MPFALPPSVCRLQKQFEALSMGQVSSDPLRRAEGSLLALGWSPRRSLGHSSLPAGPQLPACRLPLCPCARRERWQGGPAPHRLGSKRCVGSATWRWGEGREACSLAQGTGCDRKPCRAEVLGGGEGPGCHAGVSPRLTSLFLLHQRFPFVPYWSTKF